MPSKYLIFLLVTYNSHVFVTYYQMREREQDLCSSMGESLAVLGSQVVLLCSHKLAPRSRFLLEENQQCQEGGGQNRGPNGRLRRCLL